MAWIGGLPISAQVFFWAMTADYLSGLYACGKDAGGFWHSFSWRVVLQYQGRKLATDYFTGKAHVHTYGFRLPKTPKPWDVLYSLCSDATLGNTSFKEFCSEFGYDEDSRKAERIHKQCAKMTVKLKEFLGDKFELFCQAEH